MSTDWREDLRYDPLPPLLAAKDEAVRYWARRDFVAADGAGKDPGPVEPLWTLPAALKILRRQLPDGSWPRSGEAKHPAINYGLIETWRHLRFLVEQYGLTRAHPQLERAAEFVFSCQTPGGDFRGILANQYITYYHGAILSLLVQAGYADDPRVERAFGWLLAMRQDDGGWSVPMVTYKLDRETQYRLSSEYAEPLEPDRSKPFSHMCTGMVLRAFAMHPVYRRCEAAQHAAELLAARFFQPDAHTSYQAASYWVRFEYPFWWNNLLAAMDSVTRIGLGLDNAQVRRARDWFVENQEPDGLWRVTYAQEARDTPKNRATQLWITLAICRVLQRLQGLPRAW